MIRRGTCTFLEKAQNAAAHGAKYVLTYNDVAGTGEIVVDVSGIEGIGMVLKEQGEEWIKLLASGFSVDLHILDPNS